MLESNLNPTDIQILQDDLDNLTNWSDANKLQSV